MHNEKIYDVIIIGGGPAAMSAAIYASRANLSTVFIEKGAPGGKMVTTSRIENYPGFTTIGGPDLAIEMLNHAKAYKAEYKFGNVLKINNHGPFNKEVLLERKNEIIKGKSIIIATGMVNRVPRDIEGIEEFNHKGVSYCAICDGPLFGKTPSAIIGGGNSAVEEAIYLASIASEVHVFVKDSKFNAEEKSVNDLKLLKNVKIHMNSSILKLKGSNKLEEADVLINGKKETIKLTSLFPYIGFIPSVDFAKHLGITNEQGFIQTNEKLETKLENIFAAGDIRVKDIRQVATAIGDGAIAGKEVANKINSEKK
ncbi:NAD(P)/FAD-dependent oxidoreductase [[Mycoplasma] mobile]|uniref:Thioredoxin reductase n=1 Tax=Mycoplasma mobile (strain ATCC 43663 / 163K / NCTC 11711) TaxID=267748 RepID=Q6KIA6_MYCM1|nr:FAD-dependent oxidoreductase [[Mycoplasma] mobile]AAT27670.1 thioredoxin reductase [Mycoplasma mobile 163K]